MATRRAAMIETQAQEVVVLRPQLKIYGCGSGGTRGVVDEHPRRTRAWRVERLDRPGQAYYLVVFGDDQATIAVAAVAADTGEMMASARLNGTRPHLGVDAARALTLAKLDNGVAEMPIARLARSGVSRKPRAMTG